jgi:hypothetical protein
MSTIPLQHYFPRAWRFSLNLLHYKTPRAAPAARRGADHGNFFIQK